MRSELILATELWEIVKSSVITTDRPGVAENIVSLLVDHGYGVDEIRSAFRGDYDIIDAVKYYSNDDWSDDENEDDSDDWDFSDDDNDDDDW